MRCSLVLLLISLVFVMGLTGAFRPSTFTRCNRKHSISLKMGLEDEPLELCDEHAELVIDEIRKELGTIFGYDPQSQKVGITGEIELAEIDGPTVKVALKGRFWHATDTVMLRVSSYFKTRIPEIIEVELDMDRSDIIDDNRLNTESGVRLDGSKNSDRLY